MKLKAIARLQATSASQPMPKAAAKMIRDLFKDEKKIPDAVRNSPEPYRAAAYHLGWKAYDGTPWWDKVMDILA